MVWGIILFFVFLGLLAAFIFACIKVSEQMQVYSKENGELPWILTIFAAAVLAACAGSNRLIASYRKQSGDKGALSTIFFILSYAGFAITVAVISVVLFIIWFIKKLINEAPSTSSNSNEGGTYEIRDEHGYTQKISWDRYTQTYRDSNGRHYVTSDGGKTFKRK